MSISMPTVADNTLGQRIKHAVAKLGDRKKAADVIGLSADQLARYIRGENEPKIGPISRLAEASNVSLEWLIRGIGAPETSDARRKADADVFLLVARMFAERNPDVAMDPERFSVILLNLYEHAQEKSNKQGYVDSNSLAEVIDFALLSGK